MKILYGIQATGNGHISRSRVMAKYLAQQGVDVTYLFSGRDKDKLFDMDIFGDFIHRRGFTFATENGKVSHWKTMLSNNIFSFISDVRNLDIDQYDLIITDFEPITAWAAKIGKIKSLAIGHQYAFGKNTPIAGKSAIATKIMKYFAPAEQSIGLHWARYNKNVFPPIIDVSMERSEISDAVVVYLPFENQQHVTAILNQVKHVQFIQYSQELEDETVGNVRLRKASYQGFKNDLCQAVAVICNSGFELNSECIHLGIPILTKPIAKQMEQESNALALEQLGFGTVMNNLSVTDIEHWLKVLPEQNKYTTPDVAKEIVDWLIQNNAQPIEIFSKKIWKNI